MQKSQNRQKISPLTGAQKGRHPCWNSLERSRNYWRKVFYLNGKLAGKRVKKKRRRFTRESIKDLECQI